MKLGELLDAVLVKLTGVPINAEEAVVAASGVAILVDLIDRLGEDALVRDDVFERDELPKGMPFTPLIRHLVAVPVQANRILPVDDVVMLARLAALVGRVQVFLDRHDLASTAHGPVPRSWTN